MSMLKMCSIRDSKAEAWLSPMFFQAKGQALRSFSDAVNGDGEFAKHPEDYTLFYLGDFDDSCGGVLPSDAPSVLANGVDLLIGDL